MRNPLILLLFFHFSGLSSAAQSFEKEADPRDVTIITQVVDSFHWYKEHGKVSTYQSGCSYPPHKFQFHVAGVAISNQVTDLTKPAKRAFIYVYALSMKAARLYENKNYGEANRIWELVLQLAIKHGFHYEELHMCRQALNNTSFLSGNYAEAMQISSEGLHRAEMISDLTMMAHFSNVIGYIHMKQRNFPEASRYFTDYLMLTRQIRDSLLEAHALYNLADLYIAKGSLDSAKDFLERSIRAYRSSALSPIRRFDLVEREGYISNKLAQVLALKGDYVRAVNYIKTSLESANAVSGVNAYDKAEYFIRAAEIYNHLQRPDSALFFARKGLFIALQIMHREHTMYGYEQLAAAYAQKGRHDSAWYYQVVFRKVQDTIERENSQRDILLHETTLNLEREKAKQETVMERQRFWRNIIIGLAIFTMIITYLLYNRYRLRQKNRLQAELNRQQLEILRTTIQVQDKERRRIAEDLHDSLGSILSAAKLKLSAIERPADANTPMGHEMLQDALSLLDEAINEMKNIAYDIMPATLSRLGLIAALQNLFNRITGRSGLQISFSTYGFDERPEQRMEVSIYRIVLESINNVVKHAAASQVTVQLIRYPDYINIIVEDNGRGFRQTAELHGNGLANIDSRVKNLGGTLDIDSREGSGTTILIDIPCQDMG